MGSRGISGMMPAVIPLIWERLPAMNEDILTALNTIGIKRREGA